MSFVLQRSNHEESLTRIRDGVSSLQKLACLNVELEPERKLRSQGRLNKLVRDMSGSIYQALRSTITCGCPSLHDVGLRLAPPSRTMVPEDDDDEVAKELQFRLVISHRPPSSATQWGELLLKMTGSVREEQAAVAEPSRSVKFAIPKRVSAADENRSVVLKSAMANLAISTAVLMPIHPAAQTIKNLCETTQRIEKKGYHCGRVTDCQSPKKREYSVYTLDRFDGDWALIPIRHVLQAKPSSPLLYGDKLRLAWIIACSVLQMHGTPWMSSSPTHSNIYLLHRQGIPQYQHVFALKHLPERDTATSAADIPTLLSLGILLIELILGQTMEDLHATPPGEEGVAGLISVYEAATKLLGRVNMVGGHGYHSAVERCIRCDVYGRDLAGQNELLSDAFAGIVGPLEQDLRNLL